MKLDTDTIEDIVASGEGKLQAIIDAHGIDEAARVAALLSTAHGLAMEAGELTLRLTVGIVTEIIAEQRERGIL